MPESIGTALFQAFVCGALVVAAVLGPLTWLFVRRRWRWGLVAMYGVVLVGLVAAMVAWSTSGTRLEVPELPPGS